ncbi:MAG: hypothetical protein HYX52_04655 [Chloroflexi bacterium]|nr:hypothetical protein [Chloroflexota bacterium]
MERVPHTDALDSYLRDVIATLYSATNQGIKHLEDDPALVERSIRDCQEILDVIMEGDVKEWVGATA